MSDQKEQIAERKKQKKEMALTFQAVFESPNGKVVLKELKRLAGSDVVIVPKDAFGRTDPYEVMRNEGKRAVVVHIESQMNKTFNQPVQKNADLKGKK